MSEFGAPLHIAILLGEQSIVEALVEDRGEDADCYCTQRLFTGVNQPLDRLIGRDTGLPAMGIAILMKKHAIINLLDGLGGFREVRCGKTMGSCDLVDQLPSPFTTQRVSAIRVIACDLG